MTYSFIFILNYPDKSGDQSQKVHAVAIIDNDVN